MFVFPAFNENFKTRKRTFRCCKNCRVKRVRCIISDSNYEVEGCDSCKTQGIKCDLIGSTKQKETKVTKPRTRAKKSKLLKSSNEASSHQQSPATSGPSKNIPSPATATNRPETSSSSINSNIIPKSGAVPNVPVILHARGDASNAMTSSNAGVQLPRIGVPPSSYHEREGFRNLDPLSQDSLQAQTPVSAQNSTRNNLPSITGLFPTSYNSPLNNLASFQKSPIRTYIPPLTIGKSSKNSMGECAVPLPPLHDLPRPPSSGTNSTGPPINNGFRGSFSGESITEMRLDLQNQKVREKYSTIIGIVDQTIHLIDHHFLKREFNFNCTFRESQYQIGKHFTAKQKSGSNHEYLSKEYSNNGSTLNKTHILQFKTLLSLYVFTLDTPGFYSIQQDDLVKLYEIYFYKFNSVFPVVFEAEFWELHKRGRIPNVIKYAVVLIAAGDELAEPILGRSFFNNNDTFEENHARFLKELEFKIRSLLDFLPELGDTEKLTRLITSLLLSSHYRFNKFGNEQSSSDLCTSIGYAYSLLIHHEPFHEMLCKMGASKKSRYLRHLWWLLFSLDRFNGILNGKAMFIHRLDFNVHHVIDSPPLQRLVALAYALEDTLISGFRPPKKGEKLPEKETADGDPSFDPAKIIGEEIKLLEDTEKIQQIYSIDGPIYNGRHLPEMKLEVYQERSIFLLERLLNHQMILVLRMGTLKTLRDANQLDSFSLQLSRSLLQIFILAKGGHNHKLLVSTPLIPSILLISFSVPSVARFNLLRSDNSSAPSREVTDSVKSISDGHLQELRLYTKKWWFVREVVESLDKIHIDGTERVRVRNKPDLDYTTPKNHMISIRNLAHDASDAECVLPSLKAISSPGFYDDVVMSEKNAEEELAKRKPDQQNSQLNIHFENHPESTNDSSERSMASNVASIQNTPQAQNSTPGGDNADGSSFAGDLYFDVARMAEMVSSDVNFCNLVDFFPDSQFDFF